MGTSNKISFRVVVRILAKMASICIELIMYPKICLSVAFSSSEKGFVWGRKIRSREWFSQKTCRFQMILVHLFEKPL
jgi:hypothetical protein